MEMTTALPLALDASCALALLDADGMLHVRRAGAVAVQQVPCASLHELPGALMQAWHALDASGGVALPRHVALAVAGSVVGADVHMPQWSQRCEVDAWRKALSVETLLVVNDFTAMAMALAPALLNDPDAAGATALGAGRRQPGAVTALIGPGMTSASALGVSAVIPAADRRFGLGSEGGHVSFAPSDADEVALLQRAWTLWPHVSAERLVSATGLAVVWSALGAQGQWGSDNALTFSGLALAPPAGVIVDQAHAGDARSLRAVQLWCRMLGTVAADVALMVGALGGVCLCGDLLQRMGPLLAQSGFRDRFEAKGRFAPYLAQVPTWVLPQDPPVFDGLALLLGEHLGVPLSVAAPEGGLLARVRAQQAGLSPAEQRVADHVLAHPRSVVNEPVSGIAKLAGVSQPTVIRFCRSLGFEGLSDFKLKLASHLSGTVPLAHSQVQVGDSAPDLSAKVLDNTVAAIVALRDGLNGQAVARAIELLRQARRVEFHGVGNSHIVAVDAQYKFLRFGISATAHADSALQSMAADLLTPGDVVVAVSRSGAVPELLTAVSRALAAGASVVAITASDSPLARKATVTLAVDHVEGRTVQLSMVSRILHLLMIDVLAVGLAMQRPDAVRTPFGLRDDTAALQPWVDWISHAR